MGSWQDLITAAQDATIAAPGLRVVTLAQWMLASDHGMSDLATIHNNYANLLYRDEMAGIATKIRHPIREPAEDYCAFNSPSSFIEGYWQFIGRNIYKGWEKFATDPEGFINFLKSKGYSTDKDYVGRVMSRLPAAQALLTVQPITPPEPPRPSRLDLGNQIDDLLGPEDEPHFVTVPQVTQKFRGIRPHGLEGAIVHYDAGRSRSAKAPDDLDLAARNTLAGAQTNGYAFATISRKGTIFLPGNMDWDQWGYHAGPSLCPTTKREGVSSYYVGFEINSPGLVFPTRDSDIFVPWFEAARDAKGNVVFDSKGRATAKNSQGELYHAAELRHVTEQDGNIKPGFYVPYTAAQMAALRCVLLWLKRRYPKSFRLDYVFGHDEVAPSRKSDPGGSLGHPITGGPGAPLTMATFRAELLEAWEQHVKLAAG